MYSSLTIILNQLIEQLIKKKWLGKEISIASTSESHLENIEIEIDGWYRFIGI